MQWHDFLDTANRLARGPTEGTGASAVSRAYYAVFHYLRRVLPANGVDVGRAAEATRTCTWA